MNPATFARAKNKPQAKPKKRIRDRRDPNAMPHAQVCRLGAKASPWSKVPMNAKAKHSARLQMIRDAAEGRPVRPLKQGVGR